MKPAEIRSDISFYIVSHKILGLDLKGYEIFLFLIFIIKVIISRIFLYVN